MSTPTRQQQRLSYPQSASPNNNNNTRATTQRATNPSLLGARNSDASPTTANTNNTTTNNNNNNTTANADTTNTNNNNNNTTITTTTTNAPRRSSNDRHHRTGPLEIDAITGNTAHTNTNYTNNVYYHNGASRLRAVSSFELTMRRSPMVGDAAHSNNNNNTAPGVNNTPPPAPPPRTTSPSARSGNSNTRQNQARAANNTNNEANPAQEGQSSRRALKLRRRYQTRKRQVVTYLPRVYERPFFFYKRSFFQPHFFHVRLPIFCCTRNKEDPARREVRVDVNNSNGTYTPGAGEPLTAEEYYNNEQDRFDPNLFTGAERFQVSHYGIRKYNYTLYNAMQCNNVLYEKALRQDMYFGDELARFNNPLRAAQNNKNNNNNANADGTTNANQRQGGENNPLLNNDGSIVVSSSPSYFTGTSFSTAGNALPSGAASGEAGGNRPNHQGSTQRPQNYNNNVFYFDEHPYSNLNNMNSRSFHFKHLLRRLFCFRCDIARQTELLYLDADHNQRMPPHLDACECLFSGCSYSNESKLIDAVYAEDSEEEEEARVLLGNNSTPNTGNTTAYPGATPQIPGRPPTLRPEALEEANNANNNPTGAPPHLYVNDNDSLFSHDEDENLPSPDPSPRAFSRAQALLPYYGKNNYAALTARINPKFSEHAYRSALWRILLLDAVSLGLCFTPFSMCCCYQGVGTCLFNFRLRYMVRGRYNIGAAEYACTSLFCISPFCAWLSVEQTGTELLSRGLCEQGPSPALML